MIQDNTKDLFDVIQKQMGDRIERACIHLKGKVKENIGTQQARDRHVSGRTGNVYYVGHDPSTSGNFPHMLSGQLQNSIAYDMSSDRMTGRVGTAMLHGEALEMGLRVSRPFLRPTLMQENAVVQSIINGTK